VATEHLQQDNYGTVWQLLTFAQSTSAKHQGLWSDIYNCKACCCQKQGKHLRALRYLQRASKLNTTWRLRAEQRANTYLNTCAVLSRLGRHREGLEAARKALKWAKVALADAKTSQRGSQTSVDAATLVALSLHNSAVQHEHLRQWKDALAAYHSASKTAARCLGPGHSITKTLRTAHSEFKHSRDATAMD